MDKSYCIFIVAIAALAFLATNTSGNQTDEPLTVTRATLAKHGGVIFVCSALQNYGLFVGKLRKAKGWKSLYVNGDELVIVKDNCQLTTTSLKSLTSDEQLLIEFYVEPLNPFQPHHDYDDYGNDDDEDDNKAHAGGSGQPAHYATATTDDARSAYSHSSNNYDYNYASSGANNNLYSQHLDGSFSTSATSGTNTFMTGYGGSFFITRPNLPFNWASVMVEGNLVGIVYTDKNVKLVPQTCLAADEKAQVEKLREEVDDAQAETSQAIHTDISESMQELHNVLSSTFRQCFPFCNDTPQNY